nr:vegetative cell wall protein gp1-like [Aegilops tauschii subsp. strangulata]
MPATAPTFSPDPPSFLEPDARPSPGRPTPTPFILARVASPPPSPVSAVIPVFPLNGLRRLFASVALNRSSAPARAHPHLVAPSASSARTLACCRSRLRELPLLPCYSPQTSPSPTRSHTGALLPPPAPTRHPASASPRPRPLASSARAYHRPWTRLPALLLACYRTATIDAAFAAEAAAPDESPCSLLWRVHAPLALCPGSPAKPRRYPIAVPAVSCSRLPALGLAAASAHRLLRQRDLGRIRPCAALPGRACAMPLPAAALLNLLLLLNATVAIASLATSTLTTPLYCSKTITKRILM